jgi:hypothetical protein
MTQRSQLPLDYETPPHRPAPGRTYDGWLLGGLVAHIIVNVILVHTAPAYDVIDRLLLFTLLPALVVLLVAVTQLIRRPYLFTGVGFVLFAVGMVAVAIVNGWLAVEKAASV